MLSCCVYLEDNDSGKSTDHLGDTSSDRQPINNPSSSLECDRPTFLIVQEWKYAQRHKEGFNSPDEQYEAWLRINHPEHTRAGNSDFQ